MSVSVCQQVHGFKGNSDDYYHPDNSCINRVLETKQGEHGCIWPFLWRALLLLHLQPQQLHAQDVLFGDGHYLS
jgi:regulator of sirC expression with transglutaminase-like and TPR domain